MEKEAALQVKDFALASIENLSQALNIAKNKCSEEDFDRLKKAIGLSIMKIDDALDIIYTKHPELDDLSN